MEATGVWMSILDYAQFKSISISSIRRYIKDGRVQSKKEGGKFFIFVSQDKLEKSQKSSISEDREILQLKLENQRLKDQLRSLQEEVGELNMLVNLYEMKSPPKPSFNEEIPDFPALPADL